MIRVRNLLILGLVFVGAFPYVATASINGTKARGVNVFAFGIVESWGGVVLQGTTEFYDKEGHAISLNKLDLQLDTRLGKSKQVCIVFEKTCYRLEMSPEVAIPLAQWVLTGQTGAYTAFNPSKTGVKGLEPVLKGFAPVELAQGEIPKILAFLDYDVPLNSIDDSSLKEKYNERLGSDFDPASHSYVNDSYINTDTDTNFVTHLADGQVQSEGRISRYHWTHYEGVQYPYIEKVEQACSPDSVKAYDVENCSGLRRRRSDEYGYINNSLADVSFESGEYIAFYLAVHTKADSIPTNLMEIKEPKPKNIFLSLPSANADKFNHLLLSSKEDRILLQWEDLFNGGDKDFNDLTIGVRKTPSQKSLQSETISMTSSIMPLSNSKGEATGIFRIDGQSERLRPRFFRVMDKDSDYISEFGFFKVDDIEGSIDGLRPNQPGYIQAALRRSKQAVSNIGFYLYPRQKEATLFVQATAIFRRFADGNPQKLKGFIKNAGL